MSKLRETNMDGEGQGVVDPFESELAKKPNWVDLAQLDSPIDDNLVNNLLYKPALRFHGGHSGLWGIGGLSRTPSMVSESRPPSYKFSESIHSRHNADACSSCDQGSLYRKKGLVTVSPVTLRRRNTIAVILVAVALLAAVATITGIILHFMHPNELLRGNVRFTIANENFTDAMYNKSSDEFKSISRKLCSEMDLYYLTSELSDFYIGCRLISLRNDTEKPGLAVHYTIDFKENPTTNEKDRIKNVILRKSGRESSDDNLYFVVRDYLVYLKSLRVTLEKVPTQHPDYNRPIIPWHDDMDFIARKSMDEGHLPLSNNGQLNNINTVTSTSLNKNNTYTKLAIKGVLPNAPDVLLPLLNRSALIVEHSETNPIHVSVLSIPVLRVNASTHTNISTVGDASTLSHDVDFGITDKDKDAAKNGPKSSNTALDLGGIEKMIPIVTYPKILRQMQNTFDAIDTRFKRKPESELPLVDETHGTAIDNIPTFSRIQDIVNREDNVFRRTALKIPTKRLNAKAGDGIAMKGTDSITSLTQPSDGVTKGAEKIGAGSKNQNFKRLIGVTLVQNNNDTHTSTNVHRKTSTAPSNQVHRKTGGLSTNNRFQPWHRNQLNGAKMHHSKQVEHSHSNQQPFGSDALDGTHNHPYGHTNNRAMQEDQHLNRSGVKDKRRTNHHGHNTDQQVGTADMVDNDHQAFVGILYQTDSAGVYKGQIRQDGLNNNNKISKDKRYPDLSQSSLQTSFNPPIEQGYHMVETSVVDYQTQKVIQDQSVTTSQSKIVRLSNDMFIIMGQSSKDYNKEFGEIQPTRSRLFMTEDVPTENPFLSNESTDKTLKLTIGKTSINEMQDLSDQTLISPALTSLSNAHLKTASPVIDGDMYSLQITDTPPPTMEVKEIMIPETVRTNIRPKEPDVQWINVFNAPRSSASTYTETIQQRINPDINDQQKSSNSLTNNGTLLDAFNFAISDLLPDFKAVMKPLGDDFRVQNKDVHPPNQIPHVFRIALPDRTVVHVHHKQPHVYSDENTPNNHQHHTHNEGHHVPHIHDSSRNEFDNEELYDLRDQHPNFRAHIQQERMPTDLFDEHDDIDHSHIEDNKVESEQTVGLQIKPPEQGHGIGNMLSQQTESELDRSGLELFSADSDVMQDDGITTPFPSSIGVPFVNRPPNVATFVTRESAAERRDSFGRRIMDSDVNLQDIRWQDSTFRSNDRNSPLSLNIFQRNLNEDVRVGFAGSPTTSFQSQQQRVPLGVNNRNPTRWHFPVRVPISDMTETRDNGLIRNINDVEHFGDIVHSNRDVNLIDQLSDSATEQFDDIFQDEQGHNSLNSWMNFSPPIDRFIDENRVVSSHDIRRSTTSVYRPGFMRHIHFGIPISTEFDGIGDIKNILEGIIGSLFNMTTKIDKMQGAIAFIKNTLHEENRPIFRLENTLQNMSASLDNLKLNLNSINETLNGFKVFLQQFDNTIFDVGDVIKYIDETFGNLDKTVQFVGKSLDELHDTVDFVDDSYIKGDESLVHLNKSAVGVKETTNFANRTLDSMTNTLFSLENAVDGLNLKVDEVFGGIDDINVSLKSINDTVHNSYSKMNQLNRKMRTMNSTVDSIEQTVVRLNQTYSHINEVLSQMNESFVLMNGTALDVIRQLMYTDDRLTNISNNMDKMRNGMSSMNISLRATLDWMGKMVKTLDKFTSSLERQNDSIVVNLQNTDLIETLSVLLGMNNTLFEFGNNVDDINIKLSKMENTLVGLESNLEQLKDTLANVNITFKRLNNTLETTNTTIKFISKALSHINQSIDAMNKTSDELDSVFDSIDKTLDMVNSTIMIVNETSTEAKRNAVDVNSILLKTGERIKNIMTLANDVSNVIVNSSGSLLELNKHMYNANESLRVIHGKTEIVSESYTMLNDALSGIEKTIDNLFEKLEDTNSSFERLNTSFKNAEGSLQTMKDTERDWRKRLTVLTTSFKGMNESISEIGSAFPNLMNNLSNLHKSITNLQTQIDEQSTQVKAQGVRNSDIIERYLLLKDNTEIVTNALRETQKLVHGIRNFSSEIGLDISQLKNVIRHVNSSYENMEMNLKLVNKSVQPLQSRFDSMLTESERKKATLEDLLETFSSNIIELSIIKNDGKRYNNIKMPFHALEQDMEAAVNQVYNIKERIDESANKMTNDSTLVWNERKHPVGIDLPNNELLERIQFMNLTMDDFHDVLSNATNTTVKMGNLNGRIHSIFANVSSAKKKIDVINSLSSNNTNAIRDLEKLIKQKTNRIDFMSMKVDTLVDLLKTLKSDFGNINETLNSSDADYLDLEYMLKNARDKINAITNGLADTKEVYYDLVQNHTRIMNAYKNDKFHLDEQDRMQRYISGLEKSQTGFYETTLELDNITIDSKETEEFVKKIETLFSALKGALTDKTKSHNYLKEQTPLMLDRFKKVELRFLQVNDTLGYLRNLINELFTIADETEKESAMIENIHIVLDSEYKMLNTAQDALSQLNKTMSNLRNDSHAAREWFDRFKRGNESFAKIKDEYIKLQNTLDLLNTKSDDLSNNISSVDSDLNKVAQELGAIGRLVDKYKRTRVTSNVLLDEIRQLNESTLSTETLLSNANSVYNELENTLLVLQNNYTNFTATSVNLSESFVLERIAEVKETLHNITLEFDSDKDLLRSLLNNASSLKSTMEETHFNRTNTNYILDNIVSNQIYHMRDDAEQLNASLGEINSKIQLLNMTLRGVNDTLHTTNEKLFYDRQKKLLADSKIPKLEKERMRLNDSLNSMNKYLLSISNNITEMMTDYRLLDDRLDKHPNINISTDHFYQILSNLTWFVANGTSMINESIADLNQIKGLWTPDGKPYKENETIADIKKRYIQASSAMEIINKMIKRLNDDLLEPMSEANQVHDDLKDINKTVDKYDALHEKMEKINNEFNMVSNRSHGATLGLKNLDIMLKDIHDRFTKLSNNFSHLNQSMFDAITGPFESNLAKSNESHQKISNYVNFMNERKGELQNILDAVKAVKSTMVTENRALNDANSHIEILLENASQLLQGLTNALNTLTNDTEVLTERIVLLDDEMIGVKENLERQEKKEFYDRHNPLNLYKNFGANIQSIKELKNSTKGELSELADQLLNLENKIENMPNVNLPTAEIRKTIETANDTIFRDGIILKEIESQHDVIKSFLNAPNGRPYSDNETIEEMKQRYRAMNDTLTSISNTSTSIWSRLETMIQDTLPNQGNVLGSIDTLLDKYEQTGGALDLLKDSARDVETNIVDSIALNEESGNRLDEHIVTFENIKQMYENISSPMILEMYDSLNKTLRKSKALNSNITGSTNTLFKTYQRINASINLQELILNKNWTSSEQLTDYLTNFRSVNETTRTIIESIQEELKSIRNETEDFDRQLIKQQQTLKDLKVQLETEKKTRYIAEVRAKMKELYESTLRELHNAGEYVENLNTNLNLTLGNISEVNEIVNNITILNISVQNVQDETRKGINSLKNTNITLIELREILKDLGNSLQKINDTEYIKNNTFSDIKENASYLERALNIVSKDTDSAYSNLKRINDDNSRSETFFRDLKNQSRELNLLSEKVGGISREFNLTKQNIQDSNTLQTTLRKYQEQIESNISSIYQIYNGVNGGALWVRLNNLNESSKNLGSDVSNIDRYQDKTDAFTNESNMIIGKLSETMNSPINTLGELRVRNEVIRSAIRNTTLPLASVREAIEIQQALQYILHDNLTKTDQMLNGLETDFKHQQIMDYIRSNIPIVKDKYEMVNDTIIETGDKMTPVNDDIKDLYYKLSSLNKEIYSHPVIDISLKERKGAYEHVANAFQAALTQKTQIVEDFKSLADDISKRIGQNDSLASIEKRFGDYNKTLDTILKRVLTLNNTTDSIRANVSQQYQILLDIREHILKFEKTKNETRNAWNTLDQLGLDMRTKEEAFLSQKDRIKKLNETIISLNVKFNHINDSKIDVAVDVLLDAIMKETVQLDNELKELNQTRSSLDSAVKSMADIDAVLDITISTISELKSTIHEVQSNISTIENNISTSIERDLQNISEKQQIRNNWFKDIDYKLEELRDQFLQTEKQTFLNNTLPELLNTYRTLHDNLTDAARIVRRTRTNIEKSNGSLTFIASKILNNLHIDFNTSDIVIELDELYHETQDNMDALLIQREIFNAIDGRLFTNTHWDKYSMPEIKKRLATINEQLSDIRGNVSQARHFDEQIITDMNKAQSKMSNMIELMERYSTVKVLSDEHNKNLSAIAEDLEKTQDVLGNVTSTFTNQNERRTELMSSYINITNPKIEDIKDSMDRILLDTVGLRLPMVNNLFRTRMTELLKQAEGSHRYDMERLNETHAIPAELDKLLNEIEISIDVRKPQMLDITESNANFFNEANQMVKHLSGSNSLLNELGEALMEEEKRRYLTEMIPKITKIFNSLDDRIMNISQERQDFESALNESQLRLQNITRDMEVNDNINIALSSLKTQMQDVLSDLQYSRGNLTKTHGMLQFLSPESLNKSELIKNKFVGIKDIRALVNTVLDEIADLENKTNGVKDKLFGMSHDYEGITSSLNDLHYLIIRYEGIREELNLEKTELDKANELDTHITSVLNGTFDKLSSLNRSFAMLQRKYKPFGIDDVKSVILLDKAYETLSNLAKHHSGLKALLSESNDEYQNMNTNLTSYIDSSKMLNNIVVLSEKQLPLTKNKTRFVRQELAVMENEIPLLNASISGFVSELDQLNKTLIIEESKQRLSNKTMPRLQERYRVINVTFEMTNNSLQAMQDNIAQLENYINDVKNNINKFDTINISMVDMESNVTQLEDRLTIMIGLYKNVQEVVGKLQKRLDNHDITGKNTSLNETKMQYESFNDTLDAIQDALRKIDMDVNEMDYSLISINDTLVSMSDALVRFEDERNKAKRMKSDLDEIENSLNKTNADIVDMTVTFENLNDSFMTMQKVYKDVIGTTAENNTQFSKDLAHLLDELSSYKKESDVLYSNYTQSANGFHMMNETLFKNVTTFNELNKTLSEVKETYSNLTRFLQELTINIQNRDNRSNSLNSSLENLGNVLLRLNETLHHEQIKFNFLASHFGGLQSKTRHVESILDEAGQYLSTVNDTTNAGNSAMDRLQTRLDKHRNLNITLDSEAKTIQASFKKINAIERNHTELRDTFTKLMTNLTLAQDRSGNITDIKQKYNVLNESLDTLNSEIESLNKQLQVANNQSLVVNNFSEELIGSIEAFENTSALASNVTKEIEKLNVKLQLSDVSTLDNNDSVTALQRETREMLDLYSYIDDPSLKRNLTSIIKEIQREKEVIDKIHTRKTLLKGMHSDTTELNKAVQAELGSTILTKSKLDATVAESNANITDLVKAITNITDQNTDLEGKSLATQQRIRVLKDKLRELNDTLYEEKMKFDFVKQNFPGADARYKILNKDIKQTDKEIRNVSDSFQDMNGTLKEISDIIESVSVVAIPLDIEKQIADDIKKDIRELKDIYKNVTGRYDGLNVSTLQDRQRSYLYLKGQYDIFDIATNTLSDDVKMMQGKIGLLQNKLLELNISMIDINSTLGSFAETKNNATGLFNQIQRATDMSSNMNTTVSDMEIKLSQLNNTIDEILSNFTDVKDAVLMEAKDSIQKLLKDTLRKLSLLKVTTAALNDLHDRVGGNENQLNNTLTSKKTNIDNLKTDISAAWGRINNISALLNGIYDQQTNANKTSGELDPQIDSIANKMKDLFMSFQKEQAKLDFIKDKKPKFQLSFKHLNATLEETNKRISNTELSLADLQLSITTVGDRLNRFRPIKITTGEESDKWHNLSDSVKLSSGTFIELTKLYNTLRSDMNKLDDRNRSIADIQKHYRKINKTVDAITSSLSAINNRLDGVSNVSKSIETSLSSFETIMNNFKSVQSGIKSAKRQSEDTTKGLAGTTKISTGVSTDINSLQSTLVEMESKYKVLADKEFESSLPHIKSNISSINRRLNLTTDKSKALNKSLSQVTEMVSNAFNVLQNTGLTRQNANGIIEQVNRTLSSTSLDLKRIAKEGADIDKTISVLRSKTTTMKSEIEQLNRTLAAELQKLQYVNETLPDLRSKFKRVNATFVDNVPDVRSLQATMQDVVGVLMRIKEKMIAFDMKDTDKSVHNWDQSITSLNKTINSIIDQNKQMVGNLTNLEDKLWKRGPMYSKTETLSTVQNRFNGYNKTLDDIIAVVHTIDVELKELNDTSQDLAITLNNHDYMLTTTPEPLGPPNWLQFTSTEVGMIGKDHGMAVCSVGDLMDWDVMRIARQRGNEKEKTVAAWKLGLGARKTIQDRRISVKKYENSTGGSLTLSIQSLQCEDEAAYFCYIDTYSRYPLRTDIAVITPPEDSLAPDFPTEVFEDKITNFSCTGHPGYPNGRLTWKIKREADTDFKAFDFYSAKPHVTDTNCIRTETNRVEYQFNMSWNNTKVRCYIENTTYFGEGIIRLLPYDICNSVRFLGTISHPYTPHKYIVCGKELNIMQCPGDTCYDKTEENCVRCAAGQQSADPCNGKPLYSYVAHEKDCKKYYICMGPTKTVKRCAKGYFNPNMPGNCAISYVQSYCAQRSG